MFRHHKLVGTSCLIGRLPSAPKRICIGRHTIHLEFLCLCVLRSREDCNGVSGSHRAPVCFVEFLAVGRRTPRRQHRHIIEIP